MKKTLAASILSFVLLVSLFTRSVSAQQKAERWVCLGATPIIDLFHQTLTAQSEEKGRPLPKTETYIVECVATISKGQICTTGRDESDKIVYGDALKDIVNNPEGLTNLQRLINSNEFTYYGMFESDQTTTAPNPVMSDATGGVNDIVWHANSTHLDRKFLAMNYYDPLGTDVSGNAGALQNATFVFDRDGAAKNCAVINWDPYGRVFDSQTLEPIRNAQVTLLFKKNNTFVPMTPADLVGGNLVNPQTTLADGAFSFVVPNGDYKLLVSPQRMTTAITQVHANYTKAYADLYPYVPADIDGVIQERGVIQHRDIPVATINSMSPVQMLGYFYEAERTTGDVFIQGKVSHPLTKLVAKSVKVSSANPNIRTPYREIGSTIADKMGRFTLTIDQSTLETTADYTEIFSDVEMIKVDLRTATPIAGSMVSKHFEPIPRYIQGKALVNGTAMPNIQVEVVKLMSSKPSATVQTDEAGAFKISSEYLPTDPYELRYITSAGNVVKVSTSTFIATNQKELFENAIDVNSYLDQNNKTAEVLAQEAKLAKNKSRGGTTTNGRNLDSQGNEIPQQPVVFGATITPFLGIIGILLMLIVVGVAALIAIKKSHPMNQ